MKKFSVAVVFLMVFLTATVAQAANEPTPVLAQLLTYLLQGIAVIIGSLLTAGGIRLIKYLGTKASIVVTQEHELLLEAAVDRGIAFAEEQAQKALKQKVTMKAPEKLEAALSYVWRELEEHGALKWARDYVEKRLEARLQNWRKFDKLT